MMSDASALCCMSCTGISGVGMEVLLLVYFSSGQNGNCIPSTTHLYKALKRFEGMFSTYSCLLQLHKLSSILPKIKELSRLVRMQIAHWLCTAHVSCFQSCSMYCIYAQTYLLHYSSATSELQFNFNFAHADR